MGNEAPGWASELHAAVKRLPLDHRGLPFLASLLAQALKFGGLTERQETAARRVLDKLERD